MSGRFLTGLRSHWVPWTVLVTASLLLVGSAAFAASGVSQTATVPAGAAARPAATQSTAAQPTAYTAPSAAVPGTARTSGGQGGMMGSNRGGTMMDTRVWLAGNGVQVTTISAARARATAAASPSGLHTGEVMQFSQNFYVELKDASGASAAEVLVDPATGAVFTQFGPAMMW